jgi:phage shock protein E
MMNLFKSLFGGAKTGQIAEARARGAVIIDVRTPAEFAGGHAEGAINMPLDTLEAELNAIKQYQKPIVLCCASGMRRGRANALLAGRGVPDLHDAGSWKNLK